MADAAVMARSARRSCLCIVDELGRATSATEGVAVAWAVAELLISRLVYKYMFVSICDLKWASND